MNFGGGREGGGREGGGGEEISMLSEKGEAR